MALPPKRSIKRTAGLTIVETVVVIVILTVLFAAGLPLTYGFYRSYRLSTEADGLVSALRRAQNEAMNNLSESSHGLFVASDGFTVFEGGSYASRNAARDQFFPRAGGIGASGLGEAVFERLSGRPAATGTISLTDGTTQVSVTVNSEGMINF